MSEPIRVAHVIGKWLGGGVESVVMNYYRHIDKTKIQFDFICDNDSTDIPYEEIKKLGGRVILVPPYQQILNYEKELIKLFKEKEYKIVHSHINTLSVFPLRAAKKAGVPVRIAHSHSTSNKKEWKRNLIKNILRPFSKVFATDYMCCSEIAGRWLFGDKEYDKGNVYLLNNAIEVERFLFDPELRKQKRKEFNISDDTLVIGHIGRFVEQKNHRFLIDIFNQVHKSKENSVLMLVGQGPLMEEMKEKVESLCLSDYVIFLGQRNDVNELYQVFDVFVFPSLYEGLGMALIEAQVNGLKCLTSTEVPSVVKMTKNVDFIGLDQPSYYWTNMIMSVGNKDRKSDSKLFSIYNIKTEANKLGNKYLSY